MKTTHLFVVVSLVCLAAGSAEARDHKKHAPSPASSDETAIVTTRSAPESTYSYSNSNLRWGVGYSTAGNLAGTSSVTGLFDFDGWNMVQAFIAVPSTSPSFQFSSGALYKRTLTGSRSTGFHVGGGIAMGSVADATNAMGGNAFAMGISAVAGFHFEVPGLPHVVAHLDGGPTFGLVAAKGGTATNFQLGALSSALGASVMYMF